MLHSLLNFRVYLSVAGLIGYPVSHPDSGGREGLINSLLKEGLINSLVKEGLINSLVNSRVYKSTNCEVCCVC